MLRSFLSNSIILLKFIVKSWPTVQKVLQPIILGAVALVCYMLGFAIGLLFKATLKTLEWIAEDALKPEESEVVEDVHKTEAEETEVNESYNNQTESCTLTLEDINTTLPPKKNKEWLKTQTVKKLKELANERGINVKSKILKKDLIEMLV